MSRLRVSVPDDSWVEPLADLDVDLVVWDTVSPQPEGRIDLMCLQYRLDAEALRSLDTSRVGLVQGFALGYDAVPDALPPGGVYANAVGVHEAGTAELAIALALASLRMLDEYARSQPSGEQPKFWSSTLLDRRVLLVGTGGIGAEIEKRLLGLDVDLTRVAGTRRVDERGTIHGADELHGLLPHAEVVFVAVPLTSSTERLVDHAFLAALPVGALVVNVSRGRVADTEALVRHTAAGRIRYATDVTEPEPLPADHPLYTTPGVLISPHVGGMSSAMRPRSVRMVRDQIARLLAGEEPANVVLRT